ncbi:MAG TPA: RDD family protein [Thermoanaerobaculia bacterium]
MICRNHVDVAEGVRRCSRCGGTYCPDCLVTIQDRPFCATCKTEQLMDVRSGVDRTHVVYGGFWQRFGAYIIDYIIQIIPIYAIMGVAMLLVGFNGTGSDINPLFFLSYIPAFFIPICYEAVMLQKKGQTVGKMALRLKVVRPDGSRITAGQAWGRAVMRLLLGCLIIGDYIPFFFTDEKTTLHDLVAGTRVVESY